MVSAKNPKRNFSQKKQKRKKQQQQQQQQQQQKYCLKQLYADLTSFKKK